MYISSLKSIRQWLSPFDTSAFRYRALVNNSWKVQFVKSLSAYLATIKLCQSIYFCPPSDPSNLYSLPLKSCCVLLELQNPDDRNQKHLAMCHHVPAVTSTFWMEDLYPSCPMTLPTSPKTYSLITSEGEKNQSSRFGQKSIGCFGLE